MRNKTAHRLLFLYFPAAVVIATIAFGFYRMRFGLVFGDEGHILCSPLRYSLGDLPFRDEVLNSLRWYDILLWPLMRLLPEQYNILVVRYAMLVFHVLCLGTLLYSLRRFIPFAVSAMVFAAVAYMNYILDNWLLTYHFMAADFISLSLGLWYMGFSSAARGRAAALGVGAGISLFLAAFCELPLFVLVSVPAAIAVFTSRKNGLRDNASICSWALVAATIILTAASFAAIFAAGLFPDLLRAIKIQMTIGAYGGNHISRIADLSTSSSDSIPYIAGHAGICLLVVLAISLSFSRQRARRRAAWAIMAAAMPAYLIFAYYSEAAALRISMHLLVDYLAGLSFFSFFLYSIIILLRKKLATDIRSPIVVSLFLTGLVLEFVLGLITGTGLINGVIIALPLQFILIVIVITGVASSGELHVQENGGAAGGVFPRVAIAAYCLCTAASLCFVYMNGLEHYNKRFEYGKLKGIYYESAKVDRTEELLKYLKPRLHRGDTLLSFYNNPMLNYLTDTRPAMLTGYPNRNWPVETIDLFVRDMVSRKRVPRYAVSMGDLEIDPVLAYVKIAYFPIRKIGPYIVWERNGTAGGENK